MKRNDYRGLAGNCFAVISTVTGKFRGLLVTMMLLMVCGGEMWGDDYVFMYVNNSTYNILKNSSSNSSSSSTGSIANSNTFDYSTCVWSGSDGSTFSNSGYYLYYSSSSLSLTNKKNNATSWDLSENKIYYETSFFIFFTRNYYIQFDSSWGVATSSSSSNSDVVYKCTTIPETITNLTISGGNDTFSSTGSATFTASSNYTPTYYTLTPNSSGTTYYVTDGGTPSKNTPSSSTVGITYTWSLADSGTDNENVKINASTGEVTYYKWYKDDTTVKINVTATKSGVTQTSTKEVVFMGCTRVDVYPADESLGKVYVRGDAAAPDPAKLGFGSHDKATRANAAYYYCYANPTATGYYFTGWYTDKECTNAVSTSRTDYGEYKVHCEEGDRKTFYARFEKLDNFWFNVSATCLTGGKSASANPSGKSSQLGDAGNQQATQEVKFSAVADTKYVFDYWSTSESGDSVSTANPYTVSLQSTSKTESSPTTFNYYAHFRQKDNPTSLSVSPTSMSLKIKQTAIVSATLLPDGCYSSVKYSSENGSIAAVTDGGTVRGVAKGTTRIRVDAYGTGDDIVQTAYVSVTVSDQTASVVGMTFNEGTTPNKVRNGTESIGQVVFNTFTISELDFTASNCLVVPGRRSYNGEVLTDFAGTLANGGVSLNSTMTTNNQQIDCETFYFAEYSQEVLDNGSLRPYTFTGWHITTEPASDASIPAVKDKKKVPGQTVFQPGDVISPEVLQDYGVLSADGTPTGNGLTFEALWGRTCFISDDDGVTSNGHYGNDYTKPTNTVNVSNWKIYGDPDGKYGTDFAQRDTADAYCAVMMLVGTFRFERSIVYTEAPYAFTYKSLQRTNDGTGNIGDMVDGTRHNLIASASAEMTTHANWRIDNVLGDFDSNTNKFNNTNVTYMETTARFNGYFGAFICLSDQTTDYVVNINGGTLTSSETFNKSTADNPLTSDFKHRYFYFGRNANFAGNFYLSGSGVGGTAKGETTVTVTGGYVKTLSGTDNVTHHIEGNRNFYIYGDRSGNQEYDPLVGQLRPASDARLYGDTNVKIIGSTKLSNVFGGGYSYTAEVNNVKLLIKDSYITGNVNGGGYYGTTTGSVDVDIENSTITGNVYGSGMGATSRVEYEESTETRTIPKGTADPNTISAPTGFPVYYETETTDDYVTHPQYSVLAYKLAQYEVWGGDKYSSKIDFKNVAYTYHLSMAQAGSTKITISNSTIGQESEKGSSKSGNVYGGGDIALVNGNTVISINNSTTYSSVYGGGNGNATPEPVIICDPVASLTSNPSPDEAREADSGISYQHPNPFTSADNYAVSYTWTNDESVLNAGGIDKTNRLIYTPSNASNGWGDVGGYAQVDISGSTINGSVYGGGNAGKIGTQNKGETKTTIKDSTINGSVFGACNNAKLTGSTNIKVLGSSVINGNVYGGGNQGEVTGKTYVQIGE